MRFFKRNMPFYIAIGAITALIIVFVLSPLYIGVADNGDFYRVMNSSGITFLSNPDFRYFVSTFGLEPDAGLKLPSFVTTHIIVVDLAVLLNKLLFSPAYFDIRFLSAIYSLLLIFAVWMGFKSVRFDRAKVNWLYYACVVVVLADIGYLAYFNSFYGEAATYVSLLLAIASYLYALKDNKFWPAVVFYISLLFFAGAKQQNCILALPAALLALRFMLIFKERYKRAICIALTALTLIAASVTFISVSPVIRDINIDQAVFIGILKGSRDVHGDLKFLGLSDELAPLAGVSYYDSKGKFDPNGEFMRQEFFSKINYGKILLYYAAHPLRFLEKMEFTSNNAFGIVQGYLGSYPEYRGMPGAVIRGPWEILKQRVLPHTLWFIILFEAVFVYLCIKEYRETSSLKGRLFIELMLFIALIGAIQFVMPYIADGEGDISKHLFIFNLCFDIQAVTAIVWGTDTLLKRRHELREKYGVRQ